MHFIPQNANLEGEQRELKGYTAPLLQGKRQHKISYLFLTVYPFVFNPSVKRRSHYRGSDYSETIANLKRTFYKRLHALLATLSSLIRVLFVSLSANLAPLWHILNGLSPNPLEGFIMKVLGCLFTYFRLSSHLNRRRSASAWVSLLLKGWSALSQIKYSCWPSKYFSEKSWLNSVVFQSLFEDIKTMLKHCFEKNKKRVNRF